MVREQVENWLEATATDRGPSGVDDTFGHGLVDAWAAVGGPGASVPGPAAGDASEPNDVPARATSLAAGQIRSATIAPEGDVDWYQISVPGTGSLTVTVTPPPVSTVQPRASEMDPVLDVYTADNRPLATADTGGFGAAESATISVTPGAYAVSVRNFSGARSPGAYTLTSAFSTSVGPAGPVTDPEWIRSTTPSDFAAGVATTTAPTISFGRALNVSSVNANTVQLVDGVTGAPLPATLAYNVGAKSVTVTPAQPFETNHPYAVHVAGVSDLTANVFTDGDTFRFRAAGPPSFGVPVKSFYLRDENAPGPPDNTIPFGSPGCVAVTGDWDGNGTSTVGAYCGGTWYLRNSNTSGGVDITPFAFGAPGYTPVVGDWDGDGKDSIGVYVNGMWYLRNHDSAGAPEITPFAYGTTGYTPVVGNWDGAGGDGIGVFVNGAWYLRNAAGPGAPDLSFAFGGPGYRPVVGNWDGVGGDGVGVVVGSGWYLRNAASGGAPDLSTSYGDASYDLVPGDWNGDHITTIGVAT